MENNNNQRKKNYYRKYWKSYRGFKKSQRNFNSYRRKVFTTGFWFREVVCLFPFGLSNPWEVLFKFFRNLNSYREYSFGKFQISSTKEFISMGKFCCMNVFLMVIISPDRYILYYLTKPIPNEYMYSFRNIKNTMCLSISRDLNEKYFIIFKTAKDFVNYVRHQRLKMTFISY